MKSIVEYLLENNVQSAEPKLDENGEVLCENCKNYEASLQKLENDVRSHIRVYFSFNLARAAIKNLPGFDGRENRRI